MNIWSYYDSDHIQYIIMIVMIIIIAIIILSKLCTHYVCVEHHLMFSLVCG